MVSSPPPKCFSLENKHHGNRAKIAFLRVHSQHLVEITWLLLLLFSPTLFANTTNMPHVFSVQAQRKMTSVSRPSRAHISCRYGTVLTQPLPLTAQRGGSTQGQGNTFADRWKDALARLVSPAFCDHPPSSVPTSSWQILAEWHNCSS